MFQYIIYLIIIIYIVFCIWIKINSKFWSIQPVFHIYNLKYWIYYSGIINKSLPKINKYIDLLNIKTYDINNLSREIIVKYTSFVRNNFLKSKEMKYLPNEEDIFEYLQSFDNNHPYISIMFNKENINNTIINYNKIIGVISGYSLNIKIKNKEFKCYYIDNLCVKINNRKKGIAPKIIQTHHYNSRQMNKNINVFLFKREVKLTNIVPLTIFNSFCFDIKNIPKLDLLHTNMNIIQIKDNNLILLIDLIKFVYNKYKCIIIPSYELINNLLKNDKLLIYGIIENNSLNSIYIFRNTPLYDKDNMKITECLCSISLCHYEEIFIRGYTQTIHKIKKKYNIDKIIIDNVSDNNIIINYFNNNKIKFLFNYFNAFYLYNYATYSIKNNNCLLIY